MTESRSTLVRCYLFGESVLRRTALAIHATWSGAWLGVFERGELHEIDEAYYAQRPSYRSTEHNQRGLFDWEVHALASHFPATGVLRLVGAGGGREVLALLERGFAVEPFECNPALLESANLLLAAAGTGTRVSPVARDRAPEVSTACDGIIVGWSAYMLIGGRSQRIAFLHALRQSVAPGTPLLLSFFTREDAERRLRLVANVANAIRTLRRRAPVELGDDLATIFVHRFTEHEIRDELADAGFRLAAYRAEGAGPYDSGFAVARAGGE